MELALVLDNTGSMWARRHRPHRRHPVRGDAERRLRPRRHHLRRRGPRSTMSGSASCPTSPRSTSGPPDRLAGRRRPRDHQPGELPARLTGGGWKGCVMARAYPRDTNDATPAAHPFTSFFYPRPRDATTTGRRSTTPTPARNTARGTEPRLRHADHAAHRLEGDDQGGIDAMRPWQRGGTTGNLGLAWGWRTLSPSWRGLWGDADLPLDYGTDFMEKVVVLMTDGNNQFYDLHRPRTTPAAVGLHRLRPHQRAGPRGPERHDDRRRRHDPQFPHDRDLHRDEGARRSRSTPSSSARAPDATTQALYRGLRDDAGDVLLRAEQRRADVGLPRHRRPARQPPDRGVARMRRLASPGCARGLRRAARRRSSSR